MLSVSIYNQQGDVSLLLGEPFNKPILSIIFEVLKAPYTSKIDISLFKKVLINWYGINTIIKCGTW